MCGERAYVLYGNVQFVELLLRYNWRLVFMKKLIWVLSVWVVVVKNIWQALQGWDRLVEFEFENVLEYDIKFELLKKYIFICIIKRKPLFLINHQVNVEVWLVYFSYLVYIK